jgi:hypothetical protein
VPILRRWGVLWAVDALLALALYPGPIMGPTRDLLLLPVTAGPLLPVAAVHPVRCRGN